MLGVTLGAITESTLDLALVDQVASEPRILLKRYGFLNTRTINRYGEVRFSEVSDM
jgi:hypothetical protein